MTYGNKLDPFRNLREPYAIKGNRQSMCFPNKPTTISQNQQLSVIFPSLAVHDVIVPGTVRLAFNIDLTSTGENCTVVQNLGRAIVKKIAIKISGNEVMSLDDCDVYNCYLDLWKSPQERRNLHYQGIDTTNNWNTTKLRVGAADGDATIQNDKAIADLYGNRFCIPLDFELLDTQMPFYQYALRDKLEYELTFNDFSRVIDSADQNSSYQINNISLEFDIVTEDNLAREISQQYHNPMAILYDRVLRHRKMVQNKSDTVWNFNINVPAQSMKGILYLFEEPTNPFARKSESFYNPHITKVEITIDGKPNQIYSQGMPPHMQWEEIKKLPTSKRHQNTTTVLKDLGLADVSLGDFLTNKYALWVDLRTIDEGNLHGSGRRLQNGSGGMTICITKKGENAGPLNIYEYVIMDAQLNIDEGRYKSAIY
jgi:hypothetical protein